MIKIAYINNAHGQIMTNYFGTEGILGGTYIQRKKISSRDVN
jgi:hypothetical protein